MATDPERLEALAWDLPGFHGRTEVADALRRLARIERVLEEADRVGWVFLKALADALAA